MMNLIQLKQDHNAALTAAESLVSAAEGASRALTAPEQPSFDALIAATDTLKAQIAEREAPNTVHNAFKRGGIMQGHTTSFESSSVIEHPEAMAARQDFSAWMTGALQRIGGLPPSMEATAPSGPLSVGTASGWDSIEITISATILPYLASYYALDSFGAAGATQIYTDHTRPLFRPVLSAGAPASVIAENAGPTTSQPFGVSGFTFGGTKYERLVLASWESLMNSELPLQGAILDELLSTLAATLTTATTTAMNTALTAASSTLEVGTGGSNDIYSSMIDLRHAIPPRFDLPGNKWMLSRATLATIHNKRASTSGVPMFDPNANTIFDRGYVINDNFDSICGAGFVTFGDWSNGCTLRRTPVQTRILQELYAGSGQVGFRTTQWTDAHFLAELVSSPPPPSFQPLYYTSLASEV